MRTLVNAGELQPRRGAPPGDETWTLTALDRTARRARRGRTSIALDARRAARARSATFLERIGRGSALAAPIRFGGRVWGVLEAYSAVGAPPFTDAHVRFAEALCAQVATAIGRAELFSRLETLAYRGPADAAAEPARARRADGGRGRGGAGASGGELALRVLRPRRAQGRQRPATATRPATAR